MSYFRVKTKDIKTIRPDEKLQFYSGLEGTKLPNLIAGLDAY